MHGISGARVLPASLRSIVGLTSSNGTGLVLRLWWEPLQYEEHLVAFVDFMGMVLSSLVEVKLPHSNMRGVLDTVGAGTSFRAMHFPRPSLSPATLNFDDCVVKGINGGLNLRNWESRLHSLLSEIRVLTARGVREYPHIVQLRELVWSEAPEPYGLLYPGLLLERAPLGTLHAFQQPEVFSLSFQTKVALCLDVAEGLSFLHRCGIIHGDIKPENVLLFHREVGFNTAPLAKLSDFSHSLFACDGQGGLLAWRGFTRPWAAPETITQSHQSVELVARSDIFSFGLVVLFVMVERPDQFLQLYSSLEPTSDEPFEAHAIMMILEDRKDMDVELLAHIFGLCLPVDPTRRTRDMDKVVSALSIADTAGLRGDTVIPSHAPQFVTWSLEKMTEIFNVNEACIAQSIYSPGLQRQLLLGLLAKLRRAVTGTQVRELMEQLGVCSFNGFGMGSALSTASLNPEDGVELFADAAMAGSMRGRAIISQLRHAYQKTTEEVKSQDFDESTEKMYTLAGCRTQSLIALRSCHNTDMEGIALEQFRSCLEKLGGLGMPVIQNRTYGSFDPNEPVKDGETVLLHAMRNAHLPTTLSLLRYGANIVQQANNGCSPLHYLAAFRDSELATLCEVLRTSLKGKNVDVNCSDYESVPWHFYVSLASGTPLHWAVNQLNLHAARFLLEMGSCPLFQDLRGCSPLHYALSLNLADFVELMTALDRPWGVTARTDIRLHCQDYADVVLSSQNFQRRLVNGARCQEERARTVELLQAAAAPIDIRAPLLFCAADRGDVAVASALLSAVDENRRLVDAISDFEPPTSALLRSMLHADRAMFDVLMSHDPDLAMRFEPGGRTYMHYLSTLFLPEDEINYFASRLVEAGAGVNCADRNGIRPLWMALCHGMISLAETLLDNGASWDDVTPEGDSLLSYLILSSQPRSPEGLKYYLEHVPRSSRTAVLAATHGQGQTPLHHAAAVPKLDKSIMMMLLRDDTYGLEDVILGKDDKGRTALHIASMCGNSTAVRLLLEAGTAVDVCDDGGDTPLALALKRPDSVERWNLVNSFNGNGADRTALQHFDSETNRVVALLQAYSSVELEQNIGELGI